MVYIDSNKCNGCGNCVDVCPQGAITIDNDVAVVNQGLCVQCGACLEICPSGAIHAAELVYAKSKKGGGNMYYRHGFGFRGASPPWPYIGRGRGGLPRCWYPGWGTTPYPAQVTKEEANAIKRQLKDIEARIKELEVK